MSIFQAIILGIIEGLTEFLPISSTGHMILASAMMNMQDTEFTKTFEIAIQLGAILAVVFAYYKRFLVGLNIYLKLGVAVIPVLILGKLIYKTLKAHLLNPFVVSITLVAGGIILIMLDKWSAKENSKYSETEDVTYKDAFKIGLFQCISLIPGVSRAAATIFGGIFSGLNRKQAAEFSFLLAIPTMMAATGYDLMKTEAHLGKQEWTMLFIGGAVAFVFALLAVKTFIAFVTKYGFKHFGYYRIILGILFLVVSLMMGLNLQS